MRALVYNGASEVKATVDLVEKMLALLLILQTFTITTVLISNFGSEPSQEYYEVLLEVLQVARELVIALRADVQELGGLLQELRACVAALARASLP